MLSIFYFYSLKPYFSNPSLKLSLHFILERPLPFLSSDCQFVNKLSNLSFQILFTLLYHLHLFLFIFFISSVFAFNRFQTALLEILFTVLLKHGKKLGQKVVSVWWWPTFYQILPTFGTPFHHASAIQIFFYHVIVKFRPNIGRLFDHLTEATFRPSFLPCFGETLNKISNSMWS